MTTTTSRRTLVVGAAMLPAASLPAFASPIGPDHPDAELLRLGAELEPIIGEWAAQRALDDAESAALDAAVERATGIARRDAPKIPKGYRRCSPVPKLTKKNRAVWYWATHDKIMEQSPSTDPDLTVWDEIHDRLHPLARDIISRKAQTVAGLAVQARAMTVYYSELWDGGSVDDENEHDHRNFIEAVCVFAGVKPLPLVA
ncbi:MAG TPA: hypothetical protein VL048_03720 [Xanthobacteraceae bacterium]|nr:hypothetical protein [Xanthobacteraceae bacterium]